MALTKFTPFSGFPVPEFKMFEDTLSRFLQEPAGTRPWVPAVDVLETPHELILKADVPEVDMKDVHLEIENGTLTLKGQRKFEGETKERGYHRIERSYGSFARSFSLPETVDAEGVKAEYKNGVLTVTLPKKELAKPRTIQVEVKN
jgi:HSP20 family protein